MIAYYCGRFVDNSSQASAGLLRRQTHAGVFRSRVGKGKLQKMKNSGNEAKEYLKTKDITFLGAANYACFACKFAQIQR